MERKLKIQAVTAAVALVAVLPLCATEVSKVFSSHMVIQRETAVPVWGRGEPGERVEVSFGGNTVSATADAAGNWQAKLPAMEASSEGRTLTVVGATTNAFKDVLVGDVWLCSGQSNMEMSFGWGIYGGAEFKAESANYPQIRRMKVAHTTKLAEEPFELTLADSWNVASNVFQSVTATGYFFARKLVDELGIPIGLIDCSWSGSRIEPFISADGYRGIPELSSYAAQIAAQDARTPEGKAKLKDSIDNVRKWVETAEAALSEGRNPVNQPPRLPDFGGITGQFNSMVSPLTRFPVKGLIWYQGCANGSEGDSYIDKMRGLIHGWRKAWGIDFPFYYVQLASFHAATDDPAGGNGYARIRDAQRKSMAVIPSSGMAVTIDVGNGGDIHPKAKLFVGERLAAWALAKNYGKDVVPSGPLFKAIERVEAKGDAAPALRLRFDYVGSGLMVGKKLFSNNDPVVEDAEAKGALKGFAIRDGDDKWYWADAAIDGDTVVVSSPSAKAPTAVRYAFRANPLGKCNLYNKEGLPASPFEAVIDKE